MSATTIQAPACSEVTELMKDLFGLNVSESSPTVHPLYSIAEYCNPDGEAVGYMACDLATSCRLGAALTQVPAGRVDEAVKDGAMPENLAENLYEVFNISDSEPVVAVVARSTADEWDKIIDYPSKTRERDGVPPKKFAPVLSSIADG